MVYIDPYTLLRVYLIKNRFFEASVPPTRWVQNKRTLQRVQGQGQEILTLTNWQTSLFLRLRQALRLKSKSLEPPQQLINQFLRPKS